MPPQTLETRVATLEKQVMELRELPGHVAELTLQIVQLRREMHDEFSAIRAEIRAGDEETRTVLREEFRAGDERVLEILREQIRESRTFMRVVHEDVIGRLATLQEHNAAQAKSTAKPARKKGTRRR